MNESTNKVDRSELSIFLCYMDPLKHCPVETFLGITQVEHSKMAADLAEIIKRFFIEKGIDINKIKLTGLVGTSAMSSYKVGLQRGLPHFLPYSIYLNCRNHRLALCLFHLIKQFTELFNLDKLLISTWKLFKYSSIKNSIFLEAQEAMNLKPLKILKSCTTGWLTHGESCILIIFRYEAIIAALDEINTKTRDLETKGVKDLLHTPKIF